MIRSANKVAIRFILQNGEINKTTVILPAPNAANTKNISCLSFSVVKAFGAGNSKKKC